MNPWPAIIWITLYLAGLFRLAREHGQPKTGNENFWVSLVISFISLSLLYWGGFFNALLVR